MTEPTTRRSFLALLGAGLIASSAEASDGFVLSGTVIYVAKGAIPPGRLTIRLRDRDVVLNPGQLFVVPRGVEHCPVAEEEVHAVLIEPEGTVNTGDAGGPLTARVESI